MGNFSSKSPSQIHNQEIQNTKEKGFTSIYRKKGVDKLIETPEENVRSIGDMLRMIKTRHGEKNGIGQIIVTKQTDQLGAQIEKRTLKTHTYNQIFEASYNLGRSLVKRHFFHEESTQSMKLIGIYSKNRYQWFLSDWAAGHFGGTVVPFYDTLGKQNLFYCLNQTEITTTFLTNDTAKVLFGLKDISKLKNVIFYDKIDQEVRKSAEDHKLNIYDFWELVKEGSTLTDINNDSIKVGRDDCHTFSYTSGTTGPPKGAMISHKNLLSCLAAFLDHKDLGFCNSDVYLSYLPLPHLMQRCATYTLFYVGALVVTSSGNNLKLKQDCQLIGVTFFLSVPRVYNRIVEGIKSKFSAEGGIKKYILDMAVKSKLKNASQTGQYSHTIYDKVFQKVRESFGGKIRMFATGSAPINPETFKFIMAVFGAPFLEGYGQTQTAAAALLSRTYDTTYGAISEVVSGLEIKLCDIPEMKYTSEDLDQNNQPSPRGEIWLRGPQIFLGYYKQTEITNETIDKDGWLRTGDVAQILAENKAFKIIDRKKNIFKLSQGEYVAPDRVENFYMKCNLVSEVFLHGDSTQYFSVIIVTPNKEELTKAISEKGIKGTYEQLCLNPEVKKLVLTQMNNIGKSSGLNGFQLAKNIFLEPNGFLSKNILTNTMKLIRFEARKIYSNQIKKLYQEGQLKLK